jgi:hypothetical protein
VLPRFDDWPFACGGEDGVVRLLGFRGFGLERFLKHESGIFIIVYDFRKISAVSSFKSHMAFGSTPIEASHIAFTLPPPSNARISERRISVFEGYHLVSA